MQVSKYEFIPGMQQLLQALQGRYEMHVISNYPVWYKLIEGKLQLSQLLPWTFVSCDGVMQVGSFSVLPFSKLSKIFFGYFDPENIFLDNENK